jgi:CheY-like chemotaxis protein
VWAVNDLVKGMEDLLRRPLGDAIEFDMNLGDKLPLTRIDHSQLEHALLNLVINARDAMEKGGRLTIETGSESLDVAYAARHAEVTAGPYVMIAVSDTGGGMPAHVIERAFEPFFTTKEEGRGTGLGLSMVYGFIKQSGGHIKIYSEVGHGTTIKLYLPAEEGAQSATANVRAGALQLASEGESILLVEDDPDVREVGASILGRLGYNVIEAENGADAIEVLTGGEKIDLLFTDIMMKGGMGGIELAAKAREKWPGLKVLFCSGFSESALSGNKSLEPGTYFISKPYDRKKLSEMLRKILDH